LRQRILELENLETKEISEKLIDTKIEQMQIDPISAVTSVISAEPEKIPHDFTDPDESLESKIKEKFVIFIDPDNSLDIKKSPKIKEKKFEIFQDADDSLDLQSEYKPISPEKITNNFSKSFAKSENLAFTPKRQDPSQFQSPKPSMSILTPVRDQSFSKRNASHLTPLALRTVMSETRKPKHTPTMVVNEVNDMVKNFFNNTKLLHGDVTNFQETDQKASLNLLVN
jgi:hypothetical protein